MRISDWSSDVCSSDLPDQPEGNEIEEAARAAGMAYAAIPVTHAGFSAWQLDAMEKALEDAEGKILAFCRSGTRSTLLWALTRARAGDNCDKLSATAAKAGYDLSSKIGRAWWWDRVWQ